MKSNLAMALVGAALISLPAAAQMSPPAESPSKATQSSAASASPMYEMKAGQWRATKLSGVAIYNNNERIGDVNELIVSRDGKIEAVVIGVGGFLGMGEHLAAVPFAQVKWMDQPRPTATSSTTTGSGTTGSGTSTATSDSPAAGGTTERTTTTTTTTTADRSAGTTTTGSTRDAYRGYPDHAVVDMTKEQLKALPVVQYAR